MKEYSKSSLRKHLRSELLSQRRAAMKKKPIGGHRGRPPPPRGNPSTGEPVDDSSLGLIRREFAIAKKLDHPNIVTLEEVLDNPEGDSLYLILEWCGKGPLKPAVSDHPQPPPLSSHENSESTLTEYSKNSDSSRIDLDDSDEIDKPIAATSTLTEEQCRLYFRDMILGIEYLHSQGVIHRDIKADNLLLDEDDVLKIADFGVSELFNEQEGENDIVTKTAGSPAYMAPELAIISNGTLMHLAATKDIPTNMLSGKSTDIWSMGVTLYYMVFGILPFRADNVMDLYFKIVTEDFEYPPTDEPLDSDLCDLFREILCKSPQKRIQMNMLRNHPWVTLQGHDPLLSKEENTSDMITPVTEEDLISAIEHVQGLGLGFEPEQVITKLRRLHGWRYETSSIRNSVIGNSSSNTSTASSVCPSRSPSLSPYLAPANLSSSPPHPLSQLAEGNVSVHRLTRALEEVVQRNNNANNGNTSHRRKVSSIYNKNKGNNSVVSNVSHNDAATVTPTDGGVYMNPNVSLLSLDNGNTGQFSYPLSTNNFGMSAISLNESDVKPASNKLSPDLVATLTNAGGLGLSGYDFAHNENENQEDDIHATIDTPREIFCTSHTSTNCSDFDMGQSSPTVPLGFVRQTTDGDVIMANSPGKTEFGSQSHLLTGPSSPKEDKKLLEEKKSLLRRKSSKTNRARALFGLTARAH